MNTILSIVRRDVRHATRNVMASIVLFVGMIAVWAQLIPQLS